jgi:Fe-S-cluster containining protein
MTEPWYQSGLAFECTRCGNCCTGAPGYVWVTDDDIEDIAAFRSESVAQTTGLYTRLAGGRRSLRERANGDCVFWDRHAGCTIYPVRPPQCRTWPFWASHVVTPEAWDEVRQVCPGAGRGALIPAEEITHRIGITRL